MSYLFKQKFNFSELVDLPTIQKTVLVVEPESDLAQLYAGYLRASEFVVHCYDSLLQAHGAALQIQPRALLLSVDGSQSQTRTMLHLREIKKDLPNLIVVTTGFSLPSQTLQQLMSTNISGHFDRRLGRPQDIVHILNAILNVSTKY